MKAIATQQNGRIAGYTAPGEDRMKLEAALRRAPLMALNGEAPLLVHSEHRGQYSTAKREAEANQKLSELYKGRLSRWVVKLETSTGPRIFKVSEVRSAGNMFLGLMGTSTSRREHKFQSYCEQIGVAACRTLGFLELRRGPFLVRSCQIQEPIAPDQPLLDDFLASEMDQWGDAALDCLADAIAHMHGLGFFHADLKGFHGYVTNLVEREDSPTEYTIRWIDLARVGFQLTRRQRIINLYQTLRFIVPSRIEAQQRFIGRYCQVSGWYRESPSTAMRTVGRFLEHKLRTHPYP